MNALSHVEMLFIFWTLIVVGAANFVSVTLVNATGWFYTLSYKVAPVVLGIASFAAAALIYFKVF